MTIITKDLVSLDTLKAETPREVIRAIAEQIAAAGRSEDAQALFDGAWAREESSATGMPGGFAIPHCRSASVTQASLGFARLSPAVDFGAKDGPADLVFLIAAPEGGGSEHMKLLTKLALALINN